ncbi:MAG: hypothetical protein ACLP8S_21400 [Solirubrobacteraceae bacterium]
MNLSVPTADPPVSSPSAANRPTGAERVGGLSGGRFYVWLTLGALAIGGLSLLFPSTPSYDPWSWLVWGREALHLSLHTPGGPTWKPLPVIFTTVFALFGQAQPDLWLVIARAGAVVACVMAFKLSARIVWEMRERATGGGLERLATIAPALLAGAIAITGLALTGGFLSASTLGYSEGLMVAAALIAVERHLDGHCHQAFALGFVAALDRPEVWLFWGPYGLWLMWKDPSSRKLVLGLAVLTLVLWFVPQKLGGGSFTSGVARAQHPRANSAAFANCPFCTELEDHAWPQVLLRIKVAAALAVVVALITLLRLWRRRPELLQWRLWRADAGFKFASERERALLVLALCGIFGATWWVLVALETQAGFSGNDRYLVLGSAFIEVAGGAGFGWAAIALARLARRSLPSLGHRARHGAIALATLLCAAVFLIAPNWVGANLIDLPQTHGSLLYQAHLREDVSALIKRGGGAKAVLACGSVMSEGFQVPMVAWYLDVRMLRVLAPPTVNAQGVAVPPLPWPNVIFQDRDTRHAALLPLPQTIRAWEHAGARYALTPTRTVYFFEDCRK